MANISSSTYKAIADLTLYLKVQNGEDLRLSDIPRLITLRWTYFRDNWETSIRDDVEVALESYNEPNFLQTKIDEFNDFIETQRASTKKVNPLGDTTTQFRFYPIFDTLQINNVELTNQEQDIVDEEILRVNNFNRGDFEQIREQLEAQRDTMADDIGLSDADYNAAVRRGQIPAQLDPTIEEMIRIQKIQDAIRSVEFILANAFDLNNSFVDPFALARANANNPDIDIPSYASGTLVKLNYGEDLQLLAARYLGDPDKWVDIAIANGLRPPYIDEIGERLDLLSNGDGNKINIANTNDAGELTIDKLYINQIVLLQSDVEKFPEQRVIANIREIPISGELVIELDGNPDLDRYQISEDAHIRVFKPNTVNSSFYVLIPSEESLPDDINEETPFFLQGKAEDEKRQKVDFAVSESGDLIFTPNSDLKLSYGLDNAIQGIKFKMQTKLGELPRHPSYGLADVTGQKNVDVNSMKALLIESISEQISLDPRYDRIESMDVRYGMPTTNQGASFYLIRMQVRLAGGETVIPISFTVTTG